MEPDLAPINRAIEANIGFAESEYFLPGFQLQRGAHLRFVMEFVRRIKSDPVEVTNLAALRSLALDVLHTYSRSHSARNMVLHLLFPDDYEAVLNNWAKGQIATNPSLLEITDGSGDWDDLLAQMRKALTSSGLSRDFSFYDADVRHHWVRDGGDSESEADDTSQSNSHGSPTSMDTELIENVTFLDSNEIGELESLLMRKKQLILEGPPGSGKTFIADKFARYFTGNPLDGDHDDRVELVQFHQSYGYEGFVQGIRPETSGGQLTYHVQPGIFLEMCERAESRPDESFVLIIDEINRGNLSRIFGELLMALEYRDKPVRLANTWVDSFGVSRSHLRIPDNLYLIGTMNSTDRSLAMIDYALRRRFYFYPLRPVVGNRAPVLERWLAQSDIPSAEQSQLLAYFIDINRKISEALTDDYQIGHSYFMREQITTDAELRQVWEFALKPLLHEYFHSVRGGTVLVEELIPPQLRASVESSDSATLDGKSELVEHDA